MNESDTEVERLRAQVAHLTREVDGLRGQAKLDARIYSRAAAAEAALAGVIELRERWTHLARQPGVSFGGTYSKADAAEALDVALEQCLHCYNVPEPTIELDVVFTAIRQRGLTEDNVPAFERTWAAVHALIAFSSGLCNVLFDPNDGGEYFPGDWNELDLVRDALARLRSPAGTQLESPAGSSSPWAIVPRTINGPMSSVYAHAMGTALPAQQIHDALLASAPPVELDDLSIERAARVACARAGQAWEQIGPYAQSLLKDTQKAALAAAICPA